MASYDPVDLAARFRQAADDFIAFVESVDLARWATTTDREGWPIGVVAHHVAVGAQFCGSLAEHVAGGGDIAITIEVIDQANAHHAQAFADISRDQALDALREHLPEALKKIEGLTAEQLTRDLGETRDFGEGPVRFAGDVVDRMMIAHVRDHLESIKESTRN